MDGNRGLIAGAGRVIWRAIRNAEAKEVVKRIEE
jgi:hypothetical protein